MSGVVVWLTGLPASGKSTLARAVADALRSRGCAPVVLDGDEVRSALHPPPGYDAAGRESFHATLIDLAVLLAQQGLVVLVAATAHRRQWRDRARARAPRLVEVHVDVARGEAERRDPKGLWSAARRGELDGLPGVDVEYEQPMCPEVRVVSGARELSRDVEEVLAAIHPR